MTFSHLKKTLIVGALAVATPGAGWGAPYAAQEYELSDVGSENMVYGTVETVREVQLESTPEVTNALEDAMEPETDDALVVRLDNGRAVSARANEMQRFEPGQPVVVVPGQHGARAERVAP